MSDRWRPSKLKRERSVQMLRDVRERLLLKLLTSDQAELRAVGVARTTRLSGSRPTFYCNHDLPWLDCTLCSKKVKR